MQEMVSYQYTVIRVVPRVEREEFMNVGVILYSKDRKYIGIKYLVDEKCLSAFSVDIDLDLIRSYLKAWELVCYGDPAGGQIAKLQIPERFRWLASKRSTIIQTAETHIGLCADPKVEMERLFEFFVKRL